MLKKKQTFSIIFKNPLIYLFFGLFPNNIDINKSCYEKF